MANTKITREAVAAEPWGEALLREMDLVIAVNVLEAMRSGRTLYSSLLRSTVSERCAPLDHGLEERKLPMVRVAPDDDEPWRRVPTALAALEGLPRGHWAVFEMDGNYDAYMSDGHGGIATESGHKFTCRTPEAPRLSFGELYGNVLGYMAYLRRSEIENEIMEHSFRVSGVRPGQVFPDLWLNGKRYGKVELLAIEDGYYAGKGDAVKVRATRRGVKAKEFVLPVSSFASVAGISPVLPPAYEDAGNDERIVPEFKAERPSEAAALSFR